MAKKVIIKLMGGLGNQMLQYATGMSLAKQLNAEIFIDSEYYKVDTKLKDTHREFELSIFDVPHKVYSGVLSNSTIRKLIVHTEVFRKRILPFFGVGYHTDKDGISNIQAVKNSRLNYLDGFWPRLSYFDNNRKSVLELYDFSRHLSGYNSELAKQMLDQNSVGIHIRRTDYLLPASNHLALEVSYYQKAISFISSQIDSPTFYFFGDDHQWIQNHFQIDGMKNILISRNTGKRSYLDMALITRCKHVIISNSTFSWWGAYLNENNGIIVVPDKWFKQADHPSFVYNEFIPEQWHRMQA